MIPQIAFKSFFLSVFLTLAVFGQVHGAPSCPQTHRNDQNTKWVETNEILRGYQFPELTFKTYKKISSSVEKLDRASLFDKIDFETNTEQNSPAISYQKTSRKFLIILNPQILKNISQAGKNLILLHELGHTQLGHHKLLTETPENWLNYEIEADIFAALAYRRLYRRTAKLNDFLEFVLVNTGTEPPSDLRYKVFKKFLDLPD